MNTPSQTKEISDTANNAVKLEENSQQEQSQDSTQADEPKSEKPHEQQSLPQQQQQSLHHIGETNSRWKGRIEAAKQNWDKLTEEELLNSDGQMQKLSELVQERYALSRDDAEKQIKLFYSKNKS